MTMLLCVVQMIGCVDAKPSTNKSDPSALNNLRIMGRKSQEAPAPTIDPTKIEARDDVVRISQFWGQDPWIKDPATGRVTGISVATYFVSSGTEKGVFVKGDVQVTVNWLRANLHGQVERTPVYEWRLNESQSTSFRVRKKAIMGYYYGLVLKWPDEIDLSGKQIEIQISYLRQDGGTVKSAPRSFRVEPTPRVKLPYVGTGARR